MKDVAQTWGINALVLALVNVLTIKEWLSCAMIAVTIGYTLWKWKRDASRENKPAQAKKKDEDDERS